MASTEHKRFMQQFEDFKEENGIDSGKPTFSRKPIDLFKLWCAVQEVGGHSEVMANKGWARIGRLFDPPRTMTDLSSRIKKAYETHLLAFENAMLSGAIKDVYMPPRIHLPTPTPSEKKAGRPSKRSSTPVPASTRPKRVRKDTAAAAAANEQEDLVGKKIRVLWPDEKQFFSGIVTSFKKDTGEHRVDYDDGDEETLDLKVETWHLISDPEDDELIDDGGLDQLHSAAEALANENEARGSDAGEAIPDGCLAQGPGFRVYRKKDGTGFEIFCLVPGLQMEDLSVKCWDSGKLLVCQNPRESEANEKWGVVPLKHKIRLPKPVEAGTARALVTLHGQLYISVSCPKLVGRPRKVPGTSAQPSSKAQDQRPGQRHSEEPAGESNPKGLPQATSAEQRRSNSPAVQLRTDKLQPEPSAAEIKQTLTTNPA